MLGRHYAKISTKKQIGKFSFQLESRLVVVSRRVILKLFDSHLIQSSFFNAIILTQSSLKAKSCLIGV